MIPGGSKVSLLTITVQPDLESLLVPPPKYLSLDPGSGHHHFSPVIVFQPALPFAIHSPFHSQMVFLKYPCEHTLLLNLIRSYNAWPIGPQLILPDLLWTHPEQPSHPESTSTPQNSGLDPCGSLAWLTLLSTLPHLLPASG